jgi:transposase-like protein
MMENTENKGNGTRKRYTKEFKLEAVQMLEAGGKAGTQIERDLGIGSGQVYKAEGAGLARPAGFPRQRQSPRRRAGEAAQGVRQPSWGTRHLAKSSGHFLQTVEMKYRFISGQRSAHRVEKMARVLGVTRSGYYAWVDSEPSAHEVQDQKLVACIGEIQKKVKHRYGRWGTIG